MVLVRSMMEDRPLDQTINFSSHVPLKGESPSSSLSSTIHNYQGMLSLRSSSPSPPLSSLSASLSLSSSLPPLSLAREKRRQSKQRIKSSPLPPVTSESRLAQNPEPHEATDDESEVTVTDTDISDDDTVSTRTLYLIVQWLLTYPNLNCPSALSSGLACCFVLCEKNDIVIQIAVLLCQLIQTNFYVLCVYLYTYFQVLLHISKWR